MHRLAQFLVPAAMLGAAATATAHEFWIQLSAFRSDPGALVKIGLRVGDSFPGEAIPRDPGRFARFVLVDDAGEHPILGRDGHDPAGFVRPAGPGLIAYESTNSAVTLPAEKFEAYLREDGLEHVIAARAARGQSSADGREVYTRCAKALLAVGQAPGAGYDRRVGLPLEIIPEANPFTLEAGTPFTVRVLFNGSPVEGLSVLARHADGVQPDRRVRTDSQGRVSIDLGSPGEWLVSCVHMTEAGPETGADWKSYWASLTFDVPARR